MSIMRCSLSALPITRTRRRCVSGSDKPGLRHSKSGAKSVCAAFHTTCRPRSGSAISASPFTIRAPLPLNVGLHRDHAFCPVPGFREVHTQIVGFGKMQQCRARDVDTLYLEEPMAPGTTHRPMYDDQGNYPWHQYETITPSIFMAVEMLPDGATPPK